MNLKSEKINYPSPLVIEAIRYSGLLSSKILWRIEHHGTENIPQDSARGLLLVSNHQTYFDPFWLCLPIRRKFRFMAWDQAFNWFAVGRCIRYLGAFPVSLEKRGVKKAMIEAIRSLRDGAMLIIFPEGSREFSDGQLLPFKAGAVRIAMEAKVPILPVTIRGGNRVWAQDLKFPHLHKVEIFYHPIFEIPEMTEGRDEQQFAATITEQLKTIIESKLSNSEQ
jgi:1-acyl-sn-glycerol-3-phosphate acyltransferase